jgi:ABC-type sulfate/molybdate transport systems ATPase subunit
VIRAEGLRVQAGSFALGPLAFEAPAEEYLAVVGPSGAGKSVLLEALAGLRPAAAGCVEADGRDVTGLPPERRGFGLVGQHAMLFPHLTVAANIAFGPDVAAGRALRGMVRAGRRADVPAAASDIVEALGVRPLLGRRPGSLSGGERQRVALARALAARPRALLLDEPLSALDQEAREELQAELRRVHERFAMTIVHVTHSLDEAMAVACRCVVMVGGLIVQAGPIDDVVARPASAVVARLTGARNVMPGVAQPGDAGCSVSLRQELSLRSCLRAEGEVTVVVRADAITVQRDDGVDVAGSAAHNVVRAHVTRVRDTAHGRLVDVQPGGLTALVPRAYGDGLGLAPGATVRLLIPEKSVHVIPGREGSPR